MDLHFYSAFHLTDSSKLDDPLYLLSHSHPSVTCIQKNLLDISNILDIVYVPALPTAQRKQASIQARRLFNFNT